MNLECDNGSLALYEELYVQVRVGDASKHAKLTNKGSFRFPKGTSAICGRIDLFQRVGGGCISLAPTGGQHDLSLDCGPIGDLTLHVGIAGAQPSQFHTKMKQAKDYLGEHGIQAVLADATKALLRDKPDDPLTFLSAYLLEVGAALKRGNPQAGEGTAKCKGNNSPPAEDPAKCMSNGKEQEQDASKQSICSDICSDMISAPVQTLQHKRHISRRFLSKRSMKRPSSLDTIREGNPGEEISSPTKVGVITPYRSPSRIRSLPNLLDKAYLDTDEAQSSTDEVECADEGAQSDTCISDSDEIAPTESISENEGSKDTDEDEMAEELPSGARLYKKSPEPEENQMFEESPVAAKVHEKSPEPQLELPLAEDVEHESTAHDEIPGQVPCGSALSVARALRVSGGSPTNEASPRHHAPRVDESNNSLEALYG